MSKVWRISTQNDEWEKRYGKNSHFVLFPEGGPDHIGNWLMGELNHSTFLVTSSPFPMFPSGQRYSIPAFIKKTQLAPADITAAALRGNFWCQQILKYNAKRQKKRR